MEPARPAWRLAAALLGLLAVAASVWLVRARAGAERAPEAFFYDLRDRVLEGDGAVLWREMLPRARLDYATFVREVAGKDDPAAAKWRSYVGLSKEDLLSLPPEVVMQKEHMAGREDFFRGAKVYQVDRWDENTAMLRISTRSGDNRNWVVRRVEGAWKVDNLWPQSNEKGVYIPRDGEKPR